MESNKKPAKEKPAKYQAQDSFKYMRFVCIPAGLMTKEQFRKLQNGEAVELKKNDLKSLKEV